MDSLINLYAKFSGLWDTAHNLLPLLGAVAGILGIGSSVLSRAAASQDPAGLLHAIHPTANEASTFALCIGLIKAHFNHQETKATLADHADTIAAVNAKTPTAQ